MIKLAIFDVDGTLLSHDDWVIPQSVLTAIEKLRQKGIKIAIASGRPPYALRNVTSAGIEYDYLIACNGHVVFDDTGKMIASESLSAEQVERITAFCVKNDFPLFFKQSNGNHSYHKGEAFDPIQDSLDILPEHRHVSVNKDSYKRELPFGGVVYCGEKYIELLQRELGEDIVLQLFAYESYDISVKQANKGSGLQHLLDNIGFSMEDCIAFGDGQNDIEMLSAVGIGVAMKKCAEELLEVADYQAEDISDDGVAKALIHFGLIDSY